MRGVRQDLRGRPLLTAAAISHDDHSIGPATHRSQIVRDKKNTRAASRGRREQFHRITAIDGVKGRRWLIRQNQLWFGREPHRNENTLAHTPTQFVRVRSGRTLSVFDAHGLKCLMAPLPSAAARTRKSSPPGLKQLSINPHHRIKCCHGLLKDHRDISPTHRFDVLWNLLAAHAD